MMFLAFYVLQNFGSARIKPNFMVVGAAKAGTTTLCELLGRHPEVFMTDPKEPRFFSWDEIYTRGIEWYESLYQRSGNARARGEGSQSYSMHRLFPHAARRIAEYAPELKLIYIVRHPLERMESAWLELRSWEYGRLRGFIRNARVGRSIVHPDFNEAIRRNKAAYEDSSNYWKEINVFRGFYPDEQILVLFFDDLKADYRRVLDRCWRFLGVDASYVIERPPRPRNRSVEKKFQSRAFWYLLRVPGLDLVYRATSARFGTAWSRLNSRLLTAGDFSRPCWKPALRDAVCARLRADIEEFLVQYDRPRDFWRLEMYESDDVT